MNNKSSTLIQASDIFLHFGSKAILEGASFSLKAGEIVGVVGRNGSGKSSFLKLLAGELESDSGTLDYKSYTKVCYVGQDANANADLSGGESKWLDITKAFEQNPDVLILDEPTNHLDIEAIYELEQNIKNFKGSVLVVSHDRYFLDQTTNRLIEIREGKIFNHPGNYQTYLENKALRLEIEATQDSRRLAFVKRELSWVRAGVQARSTKDKGRLDRFYEQYDKKSANKDEELNLLLPKIKPLSNKIINLENITVVAGNKKIVEDLSFSFQPKTRLGIVGANGSGKTSLIKAILGEIEPISGKIVIGYNTVFNYQDQEKLSLNLDKTAMQEIADDEEKTSFGYEIIATRKYLKHFLFSSQQLQTKISNFSGGQRARLLLAKILKQAGNCLVLDEPTNDLDLETIKVLEDSLKAFEGVAIIVSHDRYFLNRVCNQMLSIEGNGKYILSTGNYDELLNKKQLQNVQTQLSQSNSNIPPLEPVEVVKPKQSSNKQQKINQKRIKLLEKEIELLEQKIKTLELTFTSSEFYTRKPDKINSQIKRHETLKKELLELMREWENLVS